MSATHVLDILIAFVQNTSLICGANIQWPQGIWQNLMSYVSFFRCDVEQMIHSIPSLDFRAQHAFLVGILPVVLSLLIMMMFQSIEMVLWFIWMIVGAALVFVGIIIQVTINRVAAAGNAAVSSSLMNTISAAAEKNPSSSTVATILGSQSWAVGFIVGGIFALIIGGVGRWMVTRFVRIGRRIHALKLKKEDPPTSPPQPNVNVDPANNAVEGGALPGQAAHKDTGEVKQDVIIASARLGPEQCPPSIPSANSLSTEHLLPISGSQPITTSRTLLIEKRESWKKWRNLVLLVLFLIAGCIFLGWIPSSLTQNTNTMFLSIGEPIGIVFLVVGIVMLVFEVAFLFRETQLAIIKVKIFFQHNLIKVVMLLLGILYTPITNSIFTSTMCSEVSCPQGDIFGDVLQNALSVSTGNDSSSISSFVNSFISQGNGSVILYPCLLDSQCPISGNLCPAVSDNRLSFSTDFSCNRDIYPFYLPASILMLIGLTIGVPYVYWKITFISCKYVEKIPLPDSDNGLKRREKWKKKVMLSDNSCKSIYAPFSYESRYYKLALMLQRLFSLLVLIYATTKPAMITYLLVALNFLFTILSSVKRPYLSKIEDFMASSCLAVNTLNGVVAIFVASNVVVPNAVAYFLIILNVGLPVVTLVVGMRMVQKRQKALEAEKQLAMAKGSEENPENEASPEVVDATAQAVHHIDVQLNARLKQFISYYFIVVGMAGMIGLCIMVAGWFVPIPWNQYTILPLSPPSTQNNSQSVANLMGFAGYSSWPLFLDNCCCYTGVGAGNMTTSSSSGGEMELWFCQPPSANTTGTNAMLLYRKWRTYPGVGSGLMLRGYCSRSFNSSLVNGTPVYNGTIGAVQVPIFPNASSIISPSVMTWLW